MRATLKTVMKLATDNGMALDIDANNKIRLRDDTGAIVGPYTQREAYLYLLGYQDAATGASDIAFTATESSDPEPPAGMGAERPERLR